MKTIKLSILLLALLTIGQAKAQGLSGSGTTDDPYLISSNADWNAFAQSVTNGTTYAGQFVKLTADITATVMAGTHSSENNYHAFSGTFDGDGHTITLNLSGSGEGIALFSDIEGATLKNLKAQGTVATTDRRPATFAIIVFGNSTISNCWSTVAVSSTRTSDWVDGGGFVGRVSSNATLNMTDCAFHGTVTFTTGATSGGGMIGYTQSNATVNLTNCLYSPTALTLNVNEYNPRIFVSGEVSGNLTNCYYNAVAAASVLANQGIDASEMTNAALATTLGVGWHVYNGMVVPYLGEYVISSTAEWNTFAQSVTDGKTYAGQIVKLTNDISVTTMAGDENTSFAGAFDGQGHAITLNMTASVQFTSLFCNADGATFQNLKVDGTINTSKKFCAGFAGAVINNGCTFTNCVSDVTINSSINGDGTHGGLVAYVGKGNNTFEGCAFTGKLLGSNTNYVGGLVGFTDSRNSATVSFTNCVFHPQQVTMSGNGSQTFARWYGNNSGSVTIGDNCYYSQTLGGAQGKQMRSITGGNYVTVAFSGNATTYERSGIDAYSVGIVYDSTLYAGNGETVSLNLSCTPPPDYLFSGFSASAGTLTGTANPYTLTMPNADVTLQAVLIHNNINYIDGDSEIHTCSNFTMLTGNETMLQGGWYVVCNNITYNGTLTLLGDVNLILCNGKTMTVGTIKTIEESRSTVNGSLIVYGQSLNADVAGTLNVGSTRYPRLESGLNSRHTTSMDNGNAIKVINYTQHSGNVVASNNSPHGDALYANHFTMNGGNIIAHNNRYEGNSYSGLSVNGNLVINGGKVEASSIYAGDSITLGWTNTDDYILADSYSASTVAVKSGLSLYYNEDERQIMNPVVISGTLTNEEISAIGGKTLRPYIDPCLPPFNLEVTDIWDTEATLHWTGGAMSYNVSYYKTFFFDSFEEDLSQWTIYKEGDPESWAWSIENPHDNSADLNAHSGYYAAVAYSDYDIHADNWLVTPQIQFPDQTTLKFWIMRSTYDDARDEYEVRLSTTGNAISDFTTILKEKEAANSFWTEVSIDLSAYDGQQGYIAIRHDYTNGFFIMVDDFGIFGWSEDIVTTDNSLLIEELLPETEYQWHVQGVDTQCDNAITEWSEIDTFTTLGTCPIPIGLSASNETNHGATLDWTGFSDSYQVMVGELDGGNNAVVSWTTYTVTEVPFILDDAQHIQPETSYLVQVKGFCDDEETEFCEPIVFTTAFSCWHVNSLSYDGLTSFSVNLSWVLEDETQTAWQICINGDENNLITANTNEGFLLNNLTPDVEYTVKVRAYCGENDYSRWSDTITFTTPEVCKTPTDLAAANITAVSADLSWIGREDVESYTVRYRSAEGLVAHYIEDFSDNIDSWTMVDCEPGTGISSGAFAFYPVTDENNPNPHQYLISPDLTSYITSNSVLEFKYRAYASSYAETFMVGFSSTNNEVDSFSWSNPITVATNEYLTYHANLPAGTKHIAIQCTSYRKYYLFIDDITVGNEASGGQWMTETTVETETQLIDLNGGTQYEVQVRSDCNPDGWCNMITFETELDGTMVFVAEGDWDDGDNWIPQGIPALNNKVILRAEATVFDVAEANTITIDEAGALIIEDGGQLKTNADVEATMKKFIVGYGTDYVETDNGYYLMTLPTAAPIAAADAGLMTEESDFDLYGWDRTATDEEWQNNHDSINLQNSVGFLYANRDDMELSFTATLQRSSLPITKTPAYDEEHGGWNLFGNPFPCEAYITTDAEGLTFYRLIDNDLELIEDTIAPLEAFFVKATADGQTFTISREAPAKSGHTTRP